MKISDLKIPYIILVVLSITALAPMPYGYYTLLKIAVTGCAAVTAYLKYQNNDRSLLLWICVIVALLFNPIIPIHLSKEIWMFFNVAAAGLFGFLAYRIIKVEK